MMKRLLDEKVENESVMKKLLSSQSCKDHDRHHYDNSLAIKGTQCRTTARNRRDLENCPTPCIISSNKNTILGSDVMIHESFDDQSEVTADTALMQQESIRTRNCRKKQQQQQQQLSNEKIPVRNHLLTNSSAGTTTHPQTKSRNQSVNDDEYSVNTSHPELPPGWKVLLSRSKNRPYFVHPDHGATWYFPGRSGWKEMFSKTKKRSYYVHPDHGATWFRPMGFSYNDDGLVENKIESLDGSSKNHDVNDTRGMRGIFEEKVDDKDRYSIHGDHHREFRSERDIKNVNPEKSDSASESKRDYVHEEDRVAHHHSCTAARETTSTHPKQCTNSSGDPTSESVRDEVPVQLFGGLSSTMGNRDNIPKACEPSDNHQSYGSAPVNNPAEEQTNEVMQSPTKSTIQTNSFQENRRTLREDIDDSFDVNEDSLSFSCIDDEDSQEESGTEGVDVAKDYDSNFSNKTHVSEDDNPEIRNGGGANNGDCGHKSSLALVVPRENLRCTSSGARENLLCTSSESHSANFETFQLKVKKFSSRVLLPPHYLCSLQRLDTFSTP